MEQSPEEPPPGWYEDPTGKMRYWDGSAWRPAGPGPSYQYPEYPTYGGRTQSTSGYPSSPYAYPSQGPFPGYPPPPPAGYPSKEWSPPTFLFFAGGGCVLALLFAALLNTTDDSEQATATKTEQATGTTTQQATQQPTLTPPERVPPVTVRVAPAGTVVRDGQFEFGVRLVYRTQSYFEGTTTEIEGEDLLNVVVDVRNIGYEQRTFFLGYQKLIDSQGREYRPDLTAVFDVATALNPGLTAWRIIPFRVPVGMVPAAIELHDSMFSGGVRVALE